MYNYNNYVDWKNKIKINKILLKQQIFYKIKYKWIYIYIFITHNDVHYIIFYFTPCRFNSIIIYSYNALPHP